MSCTRRQYLVVHGNRQWFKGRLRDKHGRVLPSGDYCRGSGSRTHCLLGQWAFARSLANIRLQFIYHLKAIVRRRCRSCPFLMFHVLRAATFYSPLILAIYHGVVLSPVRWGIGDLGQGASAAEVEG
ncbi:hypothetical protein NEOLEDRAFT_951627 [Neolentinus lepideus HHB14362 ss-1]|uniref:Uncharacterized protein n=1 Tax=Neolentinus lepideus HHB14362 ss-1 TaxID=1314782 RepID=A0A165UED9_9AGAM|nr:hypothetical protein NEOLEDRAFT_951627 [Neolentinus lepideus HHB14362 ss-1]